jgi:hypothetical protein
MKILHGHVGTNVRVQIGCTAVELTPDNPRGYEYVEGHGFYGTFGDSTFSIDPDGTLYIYGDRSKPAHHIYPPDGWLWVGDEMDNGAFNTAHGTLESPTEGHG